MATTDLTAYPLLHVLFFAVAVLLHVYVPGASWSWIFPAAARAEGARWARPLVAAAEAVLLGLLLSLLSVLVLAQRGTFSASVEWRVIGGITVAGFLAGMLWRRKRFARCLVQCAPGFVVLGLALAVLMSLPRRGEWILGGWDPGVNINEGVCVSREGTFHPEPSPCFQELRGESLAAFTRPFAGLYEAFPGIPVDLRTGAFRFYFYPMTPVAVAIMHRCGDLRAAVRTNEFLGLFAVLMFAAMLCVSGLGAAQVVLTAILFAAQPVFLYHLHTPASEVLELLLFCVLGFCLARRAESGVFAVVAALALVTAVLNRISFELFAALLIPVLAGADLERSDRRRVLAEHALLAVGLAAGAAFYEFVSPATTAKLGTTVLRIRVLEAVAVIGALALDLLASRTEVRERLLRWTAGMRGVAVLAAIFLAAFSLLVLPGGHLDSFAENARKLAPYFGRPVLALAGLGAVVLLFSRDGGAASRQGKGLLVFLAAALLVVLRFRHAAELYPWATKRYLFSAVPLAAILSGYVLWRAWSVGGGRRAWCRVLSGTALAAVLAVHGTWIRGAWAETEYDGASRMLAAVARQVGDRDVVVADHFWWGTPLTFIYGKQVLNGERLWASKDPQQVQAGMDFVRRLRGEGWQIWFLTSSDKGAGIFPLDSKALTLRWTSGAERLREIVQQKKPTGFMTRERGFDFRLYSWDAE